LRINHKLNGGKNTFVPERFITYDTETDWNVSTIKNPRNGKLSKVNDHFLKLGVARYYSPEYKEEIVFYTVRQFWDWVVSKFNKPKIKLYLFAHNQHFDAMITDMFHELPERGFEQTTHPVIDSNLIILNYTKESKEQSLTVLDTLNFFKSSLKDIGKHLGLEKLTLLESFEERKKKNIPANLDDELKVYCKRDVEVTEKIILELFKFIKMEDLGTFQNTLPAQSFMAFKHRFLDGDLYIHNNLKATALERASYHGGRNEAFYIGQTSERITVLDFNSLYPSVMLGNYYPYDLNAYSAKNDYDSLLSDLEEYLVIARLKVKVDKPLLAVKKDRLIFPTGSYWGTFSTPEIERLIKDDSILEVGAVATYHKRMIFNKFVEYFYNKRLEAKARHDDIMAEFYKLFLNSLYGKFGQLTKECICLGDSDINDVHSKIVIECPDPLDMKKDFSYLEKSIGGKKYMYQRTATESFNSFPGIASHVTAYGRMKILDAIEKAGWENVYYCDTDSVFVNDTGLKNLSGLIDSKKLGYLKTEYTSELGMTIKGCKDYEIYKSDSDKGITSKITKIKGITKNALKLSDNEYVVYRFMKITSSMNRGNVGIVREFPMSKKLSREYKKGTILNSGWVKPIELMEV
jgi:hypothetical protein